MGADALPAGRHPRGPSGTGNACGLLTTLAALLGFLLELCIFGLGRLGDAWCHLHVWDSTGQ